MANNGNLKTPTSEQAREYGRRGGLASSKKQKERKQLKEELLLLLSEGDTQKKISLALIQKAMQGDTKAFEVIRDSIGEKQIEKVETTGSQTVNIKFEGDISSWSK